MNSWDTSNSGLIQNLISSWNKITHRDFNFNFQNQKLVLSTNYSSWKYSCLECDPKEGQYGGRGHGWERVSKAKVERNVWHILGFSEWGGRYLNHKKTSVRGVQLFSETTELIMSCKGTQSCGITQTQTAPLINGHLFTVNTNAGLKVSVCLPVHKVCYTWLTAKAQKRRITWTWPAPNTPPPI